MTTTVDADAPSGQADVPTRSRRRWWIRGLVLLLVLAAFAPVVWWRVSVERYQLVDGGGFWFGPLASENQAGYDTEYCYPVTAGQAIDLGFSVLNDGSHAVTLTGVGQLHQGMSQSVTVDRETRGGQDGRASAVRLPVTIHPGDARMIYLHLMPVAGFEWSPGGWSSTGTVDLRFTVLNSTHVQNFAIGDGETFITLMGADPKKNACDRYTPPLGNG